jgi:hypothetical protein
MVESLLRSAKAAEGLQGKLAADIWDQGDAVAAWSGERLSCVVFPTASTIDRVGKARGLGGRPGRRLQAAAGRGGRGAGEWGIGGAGRGAGRLCVGRAGRRAASLAAGGAGGLAAPGAW